MKHSLNKQILALSIILPLICSCASRQIMKEMSNMESIIDEKPDSVMVALTSIDTCRLGNKLMAKYHLLLAMALDKNHIDTADIKVISPAVKYYGQHGSKEDKMKTYFYLGRIQFNAKEYSDAMVSQLKAKSYADEIGDTYWKAMLASALGYTFNFNMCVSGEVYWMKDALELWKEYGDSTHISIAMLNLARAYHNNHEFERSDSLYMIQKELGNKRALLYLAGNEMQRNNPDPKIAVNLYNEAILFSVPFSIQDYYRYAYALELIGEHNSSQSLLSQLDSYPQDLKTDYLKYKIAEHQSSYKEASEYLSSYTTRADSIVRAQLDQSVYRAQSDYYFLTAQYSDAKRRVANLRLVAYGLLFLMTLFVIIVVFRTKQRRIQNRNEELSLLYEEAQNMITSIKMQEDMSRRLSESKLRDIESRLFSLRSSFAKTYQDQFDTIARLLENRRDSISHFDAAREQYASRIATLLGDIRKGEKGQKAFERRIDSELDGIMSKLRTDYPNFKEFDYRVLSYLVVGFDATTRSFILGGTANNMRVIKNRLLTYIRKHPTENEELYKVFLLL